ncbi:MFS transporter [Campylobacter geochelonis]|uniref:Putative transport protein n=1 Tax=Campylobacter geochelonis TaxID=1780362 RepID=A0A128EFQ9_9BACT|nr:MFS transporter [Campylobacter geochelonis]QKF71404.1 major facilitator superfamily transporter [Campylobacter geochelonis]CZE47745.1 putative transport protein [Campylobacter geochelonis]CZE48411.1 putative transport protein [Campylobacter geochelonis]CZE50895.1 putative transport protein [Campylobacter geochelonis]
MKRVDIAIMYICTALTLCVMYATQPLQPLFEEMLKVSKFEASLFTTSILAPLAVASIVYGYFLEKFSIKKILVVAFLLFGILELAFAFSSTYLVLLNIRAAQGLIAPAALTGIMSYISQNSHPSKVSSAIGVYIGITIIGGFVGRFLSGFFTDLFGWRFFFVVLGILLLIATLLLTRISGDANPNYIKPKLSDIITTFKIKHNCYIYLAIFCVFFTFQAVLNFLPFELMILDGGYSGSKTGIMYFGYIVGVLISFNIKKIVEILKTSPNAIMVGVLIYIFSIQILRFENLYVLFGAMIIFCLGNFLAHVAASAYVNKMAQNHKAIANGLYISFYYAGGALGSFVPGVFYRTGGWSLFLTFLSVVVALSLVFIWLLNKYAKTI